MRRIRIVLAVVLSLALVASACGDDDDAADTTAAPGTTAAATTQAPDTTAASAEPVAVCELAYFTGEFAAYGPSLTADVVFPITQVINNDPPLGREWVTYHEDLG